MFKRLNKRNRGQNTAEYAILIALVVAAVIAMQTFVKRGLQGRMFAASKHMADKTDMNVDGGPTLQYEPYYTKSEYDSTKESEDRKEIEPGTITSISDSKVERLTGYTSQSYNTAESVAGGMTAEDP